MICAKLLERKNIKYMKITIKTDKKTPNRKNLKQEILDKLNKLVGYHSSSFFAWNDHNLLCRQCANVEKHNKIVILLALFTDSNNSNFDTYTCFGLVHYAVEFAGYDSETKLQALSDFVDSIGDNVEIEIIQ